jgi:hypothetical protein
VVPASGGNPEAAERREFGKVAPATTIPFTLTSSCAGAIIFWEYVIAILAIPAW